MTLLGGRTQTCDGSTQGPTPRWIPVGNANQIPVLPQPKFLPLRRIEPKPATLPPRSEPKSTPPRRSGPKSTMSPRSGEQKLTPLREQRPPVSAIEPAALVTARERSLGKQMSKLSKLAEELCTRFPEDAPRISSVESIILSMPLSLTRMGILTPQIVNLSPKAHSHVFIDQ